MGRKFKYVLYNKDNKGHKISDINAIKEGFPTSDPKRMNLTLCGNTTDADEDVPASATPTEEIQERYECILHTDNKVYARKIRNDENGYLEDDIYELNAELKVPGNALLDLSKLMTHLETAKTLQWSEGVNPELPHDAIIRKKEKRRVTVTFDRDPKHRKNPQIWHKVRMADENDYQVISWSDESSSGQKLFARPYDKNGKLTDEVYWYSEGSKGNDLFLQPNKNLISFLPWSSADSYEAEIESRKTRIYGGMTESQVLQRITKIQKETQKGDQKRGLTESERQWMETLAQNLFELQARIAENQSLTRLNHNKDEMPIVRQYSASKGNELQNLINQVTSIIKRNARHVMVQQIGDDKQMAFTTTTERNQMQYSSNVAENNIIMVYYPKMVKTIDHSLRTSDRGENAYMVIQSNNWEDLTKPENMAGAVVTMLSNADLDKPIYVRTNTGNPEIVEEWIFALLEAAKQEGLLGRVEKCLQPSNIVEKITAEEDPFSGISKVAKKRKKVKTAITQARTARNEALEEEPSDSPGGDEDTTDGGTARLIVAGPPSPKS